MLVGEQPGDQEDLQGRPFVGPAGQVLNEALDEAGLDRRRLFLTNPVKPFKFEPSSNRRLHQNHTTGAIDIRPRSLDRERALVQPKLIVPFGPTALPGWMGNTVRTTPK